MFDNKVLLITGGTGSFGTAFVERTLMKYNPAKIIVFSRDEMKQWEMRERFSDAKNLRFFLGDVRDRERLERALYGVDYVIHAAELKIVPAAEYDPFECIKTNVNGAINVIDACLNTNVKKLVALSTDKASEPVNLYRASKLVSDKLFVAANSYSDGNQTKFSVVRYGNVMGSRGSVIPLFKSLKKTGELPITSFKMTRFVLTLDQSVDVVWNAFEDMQGGEIYVKKLPSIKVTDIAKAIAPEAKLVEVGVRAGKKMHEQMISNSDASFTYEYDDYLKTLPRLQVWAQPFNIPEDGKLVSSEFSYDSSCNDKWMTPCELKTWLDLEL